MEPTPAPPRRYRWRTVDAVGVQEMTLHHYAASVLNALGVPSQHGNIEMLRYSWV